MTCYAPVNACGLRLTALASTGAWATGNTAVVSDGHASINISNEVEAGETWRQRLPSGRYVPRAEDLVQIDFVDVSIDFVKVDPAVYAIATGARVLEAWNGDFAGFSVAYRQSVPAFFALEAWSVLPEVTASRAYYYWLLPFVSDGHVADGYVLENDAVSFSMTAKGYQNPNWGVGPWNVVEQDGSGTPGKLLDAVLPDELVYHIGTAVAPPTAACGYTTVP